MYQMGGYQILDLKGVVLSNTAVKIKDVYKTIKNSNDKAILVSGANFNGTKVADTFASAIPGENKYTFVVCGNQFEIASDDTVKVVAYNGGGVIPTINGYGQFGIVKVVDTPNVHGGKSIRVVTSGTNKGAITINALNSIQAISAEADLSAVITAFNSLIADMKSKTIMK